MNVPHNLFAQLQCLLLLFCADILDSHAQSDQRLCCLNAASHDKIIAAIQPSQKFLHSAPSRQFPWRQAKAAPNVPLRKVSSGKSLVSDSSPPSRWLNAACCKLQPTGALAHYWVMNGYPLSCMALLLP